MTTLTSTESARSMLPQAASAARSVLRRASLAGTARILLGALFFVCGLDGFLHFIPMPDEPVSAGAMAFGAALMQTGYMFPLIKGTEVLCGVLLLVNRKVPLALVILAPVVVNIALFNYFFAPSGLPIVAAIVAATLTVAWTHRAAYRTLLAS